MINTKELRVGNLVMVNGDYIGKVESVAAEGINGVPYGDFDMGYDEAEGIPITEEWLERMGFEPDNGGWRLKISETMFLWWGKFERTFRICVTEVDYSYPIYLQSPTYHFQYVHQLQNLYFALTGEELQLQ